MTAPSVKFDMGLKSLEEEEKGARLALVKPFLANSGLFTEDAPAAGSLCGSLHSASLAASFTVRTSNENDFIHTSRLITRDKTEETRLPRAACRSWAPSILLDPPPFTLTLQSFI